MASPTSAAGSPAPERASGLSPYDTLASSVTRFLVEVAAWVFGPWAAVDTGLPLWAGLIVAVVLVALPATFNAAGDKEKDGVLVPGPVRLAVEVFLGMVAIVGAAILWDWPGGVGAFLFVALAGVAGRRRAAWLLAGAGKR